MKALVLTILLMLPAALFAQDSLPAGTILPVRLDTTLSSRESKPGETITARIMQNVPLAGGRIIRAGARVTGRVVDAAPLIGGDGARVSFQFDGLVFSKTTIPIRTNLRALASPLEVDGAQLPEFGADRGTPSVAWTTTQVGGETVYRGGGHVMNAGQVVGEPVSDGVLARASARPGTPCSDGADENNRPQALWVFSSDACGLYGYPHVTLAHAGGTNPAGKVTLASPSRDLKIWSGSGMLLRVN